MPWFTPGPWRAQRTKPIKGIAVSPGWFITSDNPEASKLDIAQVHLSASQNEEEQTGNSRMLAAAEESYDCARFVADQCMHIAIRMRNKDKHLSAASVAGILENMAVVCQKVLDKIQPCTLEAELRDAWVSKKDITLTYCGRKRKVPTPPLVFGFIDSFDYGRRLPAPFEFELPIENVVP